VRASADLFAARVRECARYAQGITIADPNMPDTPIVYVNEAFCRITGYAREEVIGRNCRFLQGPDTDPAVVALLRGALEQARPGRSAPQRAGAGAAAAAGGVAGGPGGLRRARGPAPLAAP